MPSRNRPKGSVVCPDLSDPISASLLIFMNQGIVKLEKSLRESFTFNASVSFTYVEEGVECKAVLLAERGEVDGLCLYVSTDGVYEHLVEASYALRVAAIEAMPRLITALRAAEEKNRPIIQDALARMEKLQADLKAAGIVLKPSGVRATPTKPKSRKPS